MLRRDNRAEYYIKGGLTQKVHVFKLIEDSVPVMVRLDDIVYAHARTPVGDSTVLVLRTGTKIEIAEHLLTVVRLINGDN